ncbi:MAG: hypothetical protein AVDCRST_MAG88-1238, partial [uncultured Thermomicrobiales bacterium]
WSSSRRRTGGVCASGPTARVALTPTWSASPSRCSTTRRSRSRRGSTPGRCGGSCPPCSSPSAACSWCWPRASC